MGCSNSRDGSTHRGKGGTKGLPDASLHVDFEYIKLLGKGGTGETYLYRERRTGELLAIKLVPRPLPRVIHQSIVREITVRPCFRPKSCYRARPHVATGPPYPSMGMRHSAVDLCTQSAPF